MIRSSIKEEMDQVEIESQGSEDRGFHQVLAIGEAPLPDPFDLLGVTGVQADEDEHAEIEIAKDN